MVRIPIPKYGVQALRRFFSGPVVDILWKLFVVVLVLLSAGLLVGLGSIYGGVVAFVLISTLIREPVRKFAADVWNRNWADISLPV